jgi:hypothetical protein
MEIEKISMENIQSLPCPSCIGSTGGRDSRRSTRSISVPSTHSGTSPLARKQEVPPGTAPARRGHCTRGGPLLAHSKQTSRLLGSLKLPWHRRWCSLPSLGNDAPFPPLTTGAPVPLSPRRSLPSPAFSRAKCLPSRAFPPIPAKIDGGGDLE